jgi:hypothetical protein
MAPPDSVGASSMTELRTLDQRLDALVAPAMRKCKVPDRDVNAFERGFWAGAVVMLGIVNDKSDWEILDSFVVAGDN